jgi:hypothetical protein
VIVYNAHQVTCLASQITYTTGAGVNPTTRCMHTKRRTSAAAAARRTWVHCLSQLPRRQAAPEVVQVGGEVAVVLRG